MPSKRNYASDKYREIVCEGIASILNTVSVECSMHGPGHRLPKRSGIMHAHESGTCHAV